MSKKSLPKTTKGLWFYGLAGSGKTFASLLVSSLIDHSFVIDGDMVRKFVSTDLNYSVADHETDGRFLALARLRLKTKCFQLCPACL